MQIIQMIKIIKIIKYNRDNEGIDCICSTQMVEE